MKYETYMLLRFKFAIIGVSIGVSIGEFTIVVTILLVNNTLHKRFCYLAFCKETYHDVL